MKVKGITSEEKVTLSQVREILQGVEAQRIESGKEMSYEFRRSLEHANTLSKTTPEKSVALVQELSKLEKMKPEIAYRIANIMPKTRDERRRFMPRNASHFPPKNSMPS